VDRVASEERVEHAVNAARADAVVAALPNGLDTPIGGLLGGGVDLSGGERQRLALARVIYRGADLWILDEPTSALDIEAETTVFQRFKDLLDNRAGLIISHRFSTVRTADRIVVLDQGSITESGTHEELMARDGRYAEMFRQQAAAYLD
jgi:ATP-binding cassette, subfamily B, bacterial